MQAKTNKHRVPLISVLMPVYNCEKYLAEAIKSILKQTFTDFEFIIVDDCSTDDTWAIIQRYAEEDPRIVPIRNDRNLDISVALNKGIEIARGRYIARMDADDWSYPDRLQKQFAYMELHPRVGISGGTMEVCDSNLNKTGIRRYNHADIDIRKKLFRYSPFSHPLTIFRVSILRNHQLFYNQALSAGEDYDLYFRIGRHSLFGNIPDILLKYRVVGTSISVSKARRQEYLTLYIRLKAVIEYGYNMTASDTIYLIGQLVSMFILPSWLKIKLFNLLRNGT